MIRKSFHAELENLRQEVLRMGTLVEQAIYLATKALKERDTELAARVISDDDHTDQLQLDIEEKCLELLALQQPMAQDLRTIGTALKIVTDLERMADHAVDIASIACKLSEEPLLKPLIDIPRMAEIAQKLVRIALQAYVQFDLSDISTITQLEEEVDHLNSQVFRELLFFMMKDPGTINRATQLILVSQHLERIADHCTNIGEWVIYLVSGERQDLNP